MATLEKRKQPRTETTWWTKRWARCLWLLLLDAVLLVILSTPDASGVFVLFLVLVLVQFVVISVPIYVYWWRIMNGFLPDPKAKSAGFSRFRTAKVKNVEYREQLERQGPLAVMEEGSSSAARRTSMREEVRMRDRIHGSKKT
jgi:hypothetical protein